MPSGIWTQNILPWYTVWTSGRINFGNGWRLGFKTSKRVRKSPGKGVCEVFYFRGLSFPWNQVHGGWGAVDGKHAFSKVNRAWIKGNRLNPGKGATEDWNGKKFEGKWTEGKGGVERVARAYTRGTRTTVLSTRSHLLFNLIWLCFCCLKTKGPWLIFQVYIYIYPHLSTPKMQILEEIK